MTLKKQVILDRLAFLQKSIKELKKLQGLPREAFDEQKNRWAAEHGLHLVAEAVFDIGNHILVACFSERPTNYEEIMPKLAKAKVIPEDLAKRFQRLGGFRNILVHDYLEVDFDKVYERLLNGLSDFEELAKKIDGWIEKKDS